jgi:hypothetical protein
MLPNISKLIKALPLASGLFLYVVCIFHIVIQPESWSLLNLAWVLPP